jgi:TolB-like protein
MSFWAELRRRNVIRVAVAYGALGWLLVEAGSVGLEAFEAPGWAIKGLILFIALGFPIALIFAWAYEMTPEGLRRDHEVDREQSIAPETGRRLNGVIITVLVLIIGLLLAERFLFRPPMTQPAGAETAAATAVPSGASGVPSTPGTDNETDSDASPPSIAVLPFVNMSGDADNEYFADGITEELLNLLADIDGLRVPSRTSSFAFKGQNRPISEIAGELDVNHVLEGSVRKAGNQVRVTAQLIDVASDAHLWSDTYDRELEDIFAIQDDISGQIVSALQLTLAGGLAERNAPTQNMQAHELYLQGLYGFRNRGGGGSLMPAVEQLEQAVALDPEFAEAVEALAMLYLVLPGYQDPEERAALDAEQALARALFHAERALELDPGRVDARAVQALATSMTDPVRALALFDALVTEHPDSSSGRLWYAIELMKWGYLEAARPQMVAALRVDPASAINHDHMAKVLVMLGEDELAAVHAQRAYTLGRIGALGLIASMALEDGDMDRALEILDQKERGQPLEVKAVRFLASDQAGDPGARARMIRELEADPDGEARHPRSLPFFWLQAPDPFFDRLSLDAEENVGYVLDFLWYPHSRPLRRDPRFQAFARDQGMLELWREHGWPDLCRPQGDGFSCE